MSTSPTISKGPVHDETIYIQECITKCACYCILALGCPEIPSTAEMWFQRSGDSLDVGCYHTEQEWHLNCRDTT